MPQAPETCSSLETVCLIVYILNVMKSSSRNFSNNCRLSFVWLFIAQHRPPTNKIKRYHKMNLASRVLKVNYGQISWCHTSVLEWKFYFLCPEDAFCARTNGTFNLFTQQIENLKVQFVHTNLEVENRARAIKCQLMTN